MLQLHLDFEYNTAKKWIKTENGYFIGTVFIHDHLLSEQEIKTMLEALQSVEEATAFVKSLNGSFAVVIDLDGTVFLSTDRERTIPLFYEVEDSTVHVYNHVSLHMIKAHGINEQALNELNNCLFVSGNKTAACGIISVMAGEAVAIAGGKVDRRYYFEFNFPKVEYPNKQELFQKIDDMFIETTKRLIRVLNGRCAVIPLSGGHDSRLLVYYLKRLGYSNIITYTYGPKGNYEATTSEKVAKFLKLDWHYVEYEPKKLQKFFNAEFAKVVDCCFNGVSSICVQDLYAIDYLHRNKVFPEHAVFVPGHSFDAIAGSFILPNYVQKDTVTKHELMNDMLWKHYSEGERQLPPQKRSYFEHIINSELLENEPDVFTSDRAFDLYQNYNIRERQAKFTCNQPKLYEYYGYDWYLPLWDNELIAFWETIDLKSKFNRKLFFEFTKHQYGDLMAFAPIENEKIKEQKKLSMNPVVRVLRKLNQLIHYVDFHYCLAYFTPFYIHSTYLRKRVLNISFFVNQKIIGIVRRAKND